MLGLMVSLVNEVVLGRSFQAKFVHMVDIIWPALLYC